MKAKTAIVGAKVKIKRSSKWYRYDSQSNPQRYYRDYYILQFRR